MKAKILIGTVVVFFAGLAFYLTSSNGENATSPPPAFTPGDAAVVRLGQAIYDEYCASCHGRNLEGQPDWRQRLASGRLPAPPHDETGHTWHHPDAALFQLTKFGPAAVIGNPAYQSDMPAYEGMLTDEEIIAVLSYIKGRWPRDIQRQHDRINQRASEAGP